MQLDDNLLRKLAKAMVEQPRATVKDLAEAIGVSRATLHRTFGSRESIVEKINEYGTAVLNHIADTISAKSVEPTDASLSSLINMHLEHREVLIYQMFNYIPEVCTVENTLWAHYSNAVDRYFLAGQQVGLFRIDINAAALTEYFVSLIYSTADAERRGRLANAESVKLLTRFFLHGAKGN
ncbi:TetR/AcrR family transcriptional regulator [Shewanella marisflavi]|uniref:TetR/AcrR family transcriptional regulator n=1 Tax=Shewanella marisflavi TaxID=260364 RepID=UPI003AAA2FF8